MGVFSTKSAVFSACLQDKQTGLMTLAML